MKAISLPPLAHPTFGAPAGVTIGLPMPPSTNNLFRNKGRARERTPQYDAWIKAAGWQLVAQRPPPVRGRVSILIEVSDAESTDTWDVANREKATVDLLVSHRIIPGDSKRWVREITMRWANCEGVRVTVRPWT
jgi:Holliday junction resolvase RusA-like endonuclease